MSRPSLLQALDEERDPDTLQVALVLLAVCVELPDGDDEPRFMWSAALSEIAQRMPWLLDSAVSRAGSLSTRAREIAAKSAIGGAA